jgi:hypothetical protein
VDNNLRVSAQRYQDCARDALRIQSVEWTARADYEPDGNSQDFEQQSAASSTPQLSLRH